MAVTGNDRSVRGENRIYCSIGRHLGKRASFMDDMKSLYYVMLHYALVQLPWENIVNQSTDIALAKAKNQFDSIRVNSIILKKKKMKV